MTADAELVSPIIAPTPWDTLDVGCGAGFHAYITDAKGRKIGVAWGPLKEKVWTAALFAGAPALLAAAKKVCAEAGTDTAPSLGSLAELDSAIRKIEGRDV